MSMLANLHGAQNHPVLRTWHEPDLSSKHLVYPIFITNREKREEITAMPNQFRIPYFELAEFISTMPDLKAVLLFGIAEESEKDNIGSFASHPNNPVMKAISILKSRFPQILIIADVCLCPYTSHGHCYIPINNEIDVTESVKQLSNISLVYAKQGANVIAPSDMISTRIYHIKKILSDNGLHTAVMSYSCKFSSCQYGPFRSATQCSLTGDRKAYQLPQSREMALRAAKRDVEEGADFLMVKPGYPYLDICRDIANEIKHLPLAAYMVSGEYAMLYHASKNKVFELKDGVLETILAYRRAGCNIIITYYTPQVLKWLSQ
eukprot:NODE_106_length_19857_cov_0.799980.p7 type:complete len:320 gc:universal NODE_106_length_19857_cov_0.799980:6766-5807(-)